MDGKQKINCTVKSCVFNDKTNEKCELHDITVEACRNCNTGNPEDESMCGTYKSRN